ncbi:hypothetical protein QMZ92_31005 [Streptomyces sp. HNM0645]|uniref:hypothetical protein n=1 Tax=Streptomyces sp. HNM0645 TaxID=2782343 RepID=UPI0024B82B15|nr:hypothetical protein [Streptomyces sp. HNM0645]MDI9888671.1 hypothetical protein [Streptomyces sp. HNM0645]
MAVTEEHEPDAGGEAGAAGRVPADGGAGVVEETDRAQAAQAWVAGSTEADLVVRKY